MYFCKYWVQFLFAVNLYSVVYFCRYWVQFLFAVNLYSVAYLQYVCIGGTVFIASTPVLRIRIRGIRIISLDPDLYQKMAGSGSN